MHHEDGRKWMKDIEGLREGRANLRQDDDAVLVRYGDYMYDTLVGNGQMTSKHTWSSY